MKKIINSENTEQAEAVIADLERYVNAVKHIKSEIHSIGMKDVPSDFVIETIRGNFAPLHCKCDALINADIARFNSPVVASSLKDVFNKKVAEIRLKVADYSHSISVKGRMFGDQDLEQYIDWDESENPFLSAETKQKIKESFITYVSLKAQKVYAAHQEAAVKLDSLLNALSTAKMDQGLGVAPGLFLLKLFIISDADADGQYKVSPRLLDYNAEALSREELIAESLEVESDENFDN
ncbi:MAG: hypothetical protein LLF93_09410 [Bacteroidales bacterium]|nr:hypothetical protein [Bacteroidales bacterium]